MAELKVVGDGPIVFFTDEGQQVSIPLSAITIDGDTVKVNHSVPVDSLEKWLKFLVAQGRLAPAPAPAAVVASMVVTAAVAGSNGNTITVTVARNKSTPTLIDVTVTETDVYEGLTLADTSSPNYLPTVVGVGGTTPVAGTKPGLVRVKPTTAPSLGANPSDPAESPYVTADMSGGTPTWQIKAPPIGASPATTSFTLEPRVPDPTPIGAWTVKVDNVQTVGTRKTFTLTVTWAKTVTLAPNDPALDTKLDGLGLAVTIAPHKLPAFGTVTLRGGAPATAATATLLAKE